MNVISNLKQQVLSRYMTVIMRRTRNKPKVRTR